MVYTEGVSRSSRPGFTLVEVMVVMAVTAMLSALILVYNASTRETLRLFTEKARVAQLILRAKSLALSTYSENDTPCGYGVRFQHEEARYALVAYRLASCTDRSRVDVDEEAFETVQLSSFDLPATLEFVTDGSSPTDTADRVEEASYVMFIPPDPLVMVAREDGTLIENGLGKIELRVKGRPTNAIVTVNASGQVTF